MAVTFTSNGYDTTTANPYTEVAWANAHPAIGASAYGVLGATDWKVTVVAGLDRTVSIAAGFGWGCGVTDKTVANETIQLDAITSGSRWDLITARRDWTPTAGVTLFTKVNGGASKAIPGGRLSAPGGIDDQPIALVQVTAGQSQPTAVVDLRCWAGNGGVYAADDLVRTYLTRLGTEVNINGAVWSYQVGANDTPTWVKVSEIGKIPLFGFGPAITGSPAAGQEGFLFQTGTQVKTTDTQGYANAVFPKPFPNGLLYVGVSNGDSSVDRAYGHGPISISPAGAPYDAGGNTQVSYYVSTPAGAAPGLTHRANWIAVGW